MKSTVVAILALGIASAVLAMAGPTSAQDVPQTVEAPRARSIVLIETRGLRYRDDLQVVYPDQQDSFCFCEVYEADFRVLRTLWGPEIGDRALIRFAGNHLVRIRPYTFRALMVVVHNEGGELWGGQRWIPLDSDTCLGVDHLGDAAPAVAAAGLMGTRGCVPLKDLLAWNPRPTPPRTR